jgi:photosystem II stability/assembly factor-like uncharacterized protein
VNTLLVGSRKGLFVLEKSKQSAWHISALHFAGEPVSQVLADPRDGAWYAALRLGHFGIKLHRSSDRGKTWKEVASPAFPPKPQEGPWAEDKTPWTVDMIWSMAAGGALEPGVLWAGCLPAGLFKSEDHGASWALNTSLWHEPRRKEWFGGGYDHAGIHSVLVDPRDAAHITLGISCGGVWQTHDGGASWALTASGMKADFMPPERAFDENIQDVHRMAHCASNPDVLWAQHHCGIYRSIDAGKNWQSIEAPVPSGFGFAVASDPRNPERAWFVPAKADSCRIPVDGQMVVTRTDDGGKSFRAAKNGLPQQHAYHLAYRHALDVSDDGTTLATASTTGGLWVSGDAGDSWQTVSQDLPPVAVVQFAA